MDLHDIWQEHKRWILGVLAGLVVYWIGSAVVESSFSANSAERKARSVANEVRKNEYFDRSDRQAAQEANDELTVLEQRLRTALEFVPTDDYVLAGKGDPALHFDKVERAVRRRLVDKAQEYTVDLASTALEWPAPVGRDETEATLLGLNVLDVAVDRLIDAGDAVRAQSPDALGLVAVDSFKVQSLAKRARTGFQRRGRGRGRNRGSDASARIREYQVSFSFQADVATVQRWLELCRSQAPIVTLTDDFKAVPGKNLGDPLVVKGRIAGVTIRDS